MDFRRLGDKMSEETVLIAPQTRRLSDLFVIGKEVEFDDGAGEPIKVWMQKLNPGETQEAVEEARPAKQKIMALKRLDYDDPLKLRYLDELEADGLKDPVDFIRFIQRNKINEAWLSARERIASEDEWSDGDYLIGLQKAWNDEMYARWLKDPEDEEAARVFQEIERYSVKVADEATGDENELIYELQDLSLDALKRRAVDSLIEEHSDNVLLSEFKKYQLFYATRLINNHAERYFLEADEIKYLPLPVITKLRNEFEDLNVDGMEGKD